MKSKTDWKAKNATKANKVLEKANDDLQALSTKLIQLNYLANSNNDPKLTRKARMLQALVREAFEIIRS